MAEILNLSRRAFLRGTAAAGGGLVLGCLVRTARAGSAAPTPRLASMIRVGPDGSVTILVEKSEMGQGVHSSLPALVAEELEVAWERVRVEPLTLEGRQRTVVTAGSASVRTLWEPLRRTGAAARAMLVTAASRRWGVPVSECLAENGRVLHRPTGRSLAYFEVAESAGALPVPERVSLKPAGAWRLIGRPLSRLDVPDKVDGSAIFGIDVAVPGMLHAAVRTSPAIGGQPVRFDEDAARAVRGVHAVVRVPGGAAVVADHYWQARKALDALDLVFEGGDRAFGSEAYSSELHRALDARGVTVIRKGEPEPVMEAAGRIVEARYEVPFLAHATMEPMNCTARVTDGGCEIWAPTQGPSKLREAAARALGIPPERVRVHVTLMGGGFGRRFESDFAVQAVLLAKAVGRPVKLIWSRDEDLRHDFYRPAYAAEMRAAIGDSGEPRAWTCSVAGPWYKAREAPPWLRRSVGWLQHRLGSGLVPEWVPDPIEYRFPRWFRDGGDTMATEGLDRIAYGIPHLRVDYTPVETPMPLGWWRSVGASQNAFFVESFIDELAHAAKRDPYRYRRELLRGRARQVLDRAAEASGWGEELPPGWGRGMAFYVFAGTLVCEVADVSLPGPDEVRVHRVVCVVDCGRAVNPDTVRAQMEGSIVFALTAALYGKITVQEGAVEQSNLHDYRLLGLADCPEIDVHIVDNDADPTGVGEPGTPPLAPAVANAIFAATGRRIRNLPFFDVLPGADMPPPSDTRGEKPRVSQPLLPVTSRNRGA